MQMQSNSNIVTLDTAAEGPGSASRKMTVVFIKNFEMLEDYIQAWEDLAADALEPNPFYEPWMLMPALDSLAAGKDLGVVLVLAMDQQKPVLCGVFPLEKKARYRGLPVAGFSLWRHIYCALCTPLIRRDCARQCLDAFLDWLATECGGPLMEFNSISGEGCFHELLNDCLLKRGHPSFVCESYARALFRPMESADKYLQTAISPKHRKDLRRKQKRLSEKGQLTFDELDAGGDAERWIDEFLALEASSWKGKQGGAFACDEANRDYFVAMAREAFLRGKLLMSAMRLDGKPIAQKFSFVSGRASFAFKIAFDEYYALFSPGMLLEVENIRRLHARPDIKWMDSCAAPIHFINRIWHDRRTIQTVLVSTGRRSGAFVILLIPFLRWLNRALRAFSRRQYTQKESQQ